MRAEVAVFALAAAAFVAGKIFAPGFEASFLLKVIPALTLAFAAIRRPPLPRGSRAALVLGALLCGTGDVVLDLDRGRYFVPGLLAFLLAHLCFITHFWRRRLEPRRRSWGAWLVLAFGVGMTALLWPQLGDLRGPVLAYVGVISAMVVAVVLSDAHALAVAGAVGFMLSDALLAWAKFISPGWPPQAFNVSVYFLGLGLLGFGALLVSPETPEVKRKD